MRSTARRSHALAAIVLALGLPRLTPADGPGPLARGSGEAPRFAPEPVAPFEPYLALAEELDIPVAVHTGISDPGISYQACCRRFRTALGNPQTIEEVLNRHPKLRVYLMHAGSPYAQETIALMKVYPQVYADIAVINWIMPRGEFHEYLRALVRAGLAKRLMFGSDQMWWPEAIGFAVEGVESATFLTEEQKADIFCNNAARFFNWEKPRSPCVAP